jgi:hypothetical protein
MNELSSTRKLNQAESLLNRAENVQGGAVTRDQLKLSQRRNQRALRVTVAVALLIAFVSLIGNFYLTYRVSQISTSDTLRDASINILQQANEERKAQGLAPIPIPEANKPSEQPTIDLQNLTEAAATIVIKTIRGDPNLRGPAGLMGAACDPTQNTLCIGPKGDTGAPGKDSPCVADIELCRGPTGQMGASGEPAPVPVSTAFVRDGNDPTICLYRTTYKRADGTQFSLDAPSADFLNCS